MFSVEVKRYHESSSGRIYDWQEISVDEANKLADPNLRCPECKWKVRLHVAGMNNPLHAEHFPDFPECSLGYVDKEFRS
jgi:hypothetical protein